MWILILFAAGAGAAIALQALINSRLAQHTSSPILAATISFAVGLLGLSMVALTQARPAHSLAAAPWWAWTGGLLGAFYILLSILLVPRIGIATLVTSTLFGQVVCSLAADHYGWLGTTARPISGARILGAALVLAGVVLIRR